MAKKPTKSKAQLIIITLLVLGLAEWIVVSLFWTSPAVTAREAINKAIEKAEIPDPRRRELLRVQLAVEDFMMQEGNNGKPPANLEQLKGTYFDVLPVDPVSGKPFSYKIEKNRPVIGAELIEVLSNKPAIAITTTQTEISNQLAVEAVSYSYDPSGKRDPFRPFDLTPKADDSGKTPLEKYDYGQLKLTAVLLGIGVPQAIVENAARKGFTVKQGTKIGRNGGEVVSIEKDRILILESSIDFTGEKKDKTFELRLRTKDQEDKN